MCSTIWLIYWWFNVCLQDMQMFGLVSFGGNVINSLRCILMVYYIFKQSPTCFNIKSLFVSPYCLICLFNGMFTPLLCQLSKICFKRIVYQIKTNNRNVKTSKHQTSMSTLPVLTSKFFIINSLKTSKNILFLDRRSYIEI